MIHNITQATMHGALNRADILRVYSVRINVVPFVDNQGEQCTFCQVTGNEVTTNLYATTMDGQDQCADTCLDCVIPTLDGAIDTDPDFPVIIEIAQGA